MGLLDIFGGGSGPEKAKKLKAKVTQKYGDPTTRQKAISQLGEMKSPEALSALLARFTITVEPGTTDADEKEHVFELIRDCGQDAVAPLKDFLRRSDQAISWAVKLLTSILPETELVGLFADLLKEIGPEYTRDPEKKNLLIHYLTGKDDPRIAPAITPFLEDPADDVKLSALKALGPLKFEPAREPMLQLLTHPDTGRRVQTGAVAAVFESGFGVQGYREKVEALTGDPYFVDKGGAIKKRG